MKQNSSHEIEKNLTLLVGNILIKTPIYPHWLHDRNTEKGYQDVLPFFKGKVLETGAGNCARKQKVLAASRNVDKYIATDHVIWDDEYAAQEKLINSLGLVKGLCGPIREKEQLDQICDAFDLPFADNYFDTYCAFEVLEHIAEPEEFLKEANRVLKKSGHCIFTMPFLYREHGADKDYQRLTIGGFKKLAEATGFDLVKVITYCGFGTTTTNLINQYLIAGILENKSRVGKYILGLFSPFIFLTTNLLGCVLDLIHLDYRFATRYHVVLVKREREK